VSVENACDTAQTIPELSNKIDRLENIILEMAKNQQRSTEIRSEIMVIIKSVCIFKKLKK
jgi:hypothetical protein